MSKNASEIQSVINMSVANIGAKRDLRQVIRDRLPELTVCLDALGDDPILCAVNPELTGRIQHVNLGGYHAQVGEVNMLLTQALSILCNMHNTQTDHAESIGIVMDSPNGGGGR
jgi:hypothetical protein